MHQTQIKFLRAIANVGQELQEQLWGPLFFDIYNGEIWEEMRPKKGIWAHFLGELRGCLKECEQKTASFKVEPAV